MSDTYHTRPVLPVNGAIKICKANAKRAAEAGDDGEKNAWSRAATLIRHKRTEGTDLLTLAEWDGIKVESRRLPEKRQGSRAAA